MGAGVSGKRLIFTIISGDFHRFLGTLTHPQMAAYAKRVGADFRVAEVPASRASACCWEKYQIVRLLREYERVLYVDTDVFIRDGAEDIFAAVPADRFGAFNEIPNMTEFLNMIYQAFLREIGVSGKAAEPFLRAPYFNAGGDAGLSRARVRVPVPRPPGSLRARLGLLRRPVDHEL